MRAQREVLSRQARYPELALFIDGEWIGAAKRATRAIVDPANGQVLGELPTAEPADLERALLAAARAFRIWRAASAFDRAIVLRRAAVLLRERVEPIAIAMTLEQGKPLAESRRELLVAADLFDWFAEEGRRAYGRIIPARFVEHRLHAVREPVGVVLALSPWNFPATGPARKIAAALAAGCACIAKPAEETPATALALGRALSDAGLPAGVLNIVFGDPAQVSATLLRSEIVRKLTFTGSTRVGKEIAKLAAEGVKRATLELGGHAPVIVCGDADPELAAERAIASKFRNAGQVCVAPTRFYVDRRHYDRFVNALWVRASALIVGDGLAAGTQMGPLANVRRVAALTELVNDAVQRGAQRFAASLPASGGSYFPPTLIVGASDEARLMREEPFGPVALVQSFDDPEEALCKSNSLPFGLAAYVFTENMRLANDLSARLESGLVGLNTFNVTTPETPFGGVKESGYGREGGSEGLDAFLTTKLISQE